MEKSLEKSVFQTFVKKKKLTDEIDAKYSYN